MARVSEMFGGNLLKAEDLRFQEVTVTIGDVTIEKFPGDEKPKIKATFVGKDKAFVFNKTNATRIAEAFGDDTDAWRGKQIVLYPDRTMYQGSMVDCIRVRPAQAFNAPPLAPELVDDSIPF